MEDIYRLLRVNECSCNLAGKTDDAKASEKGKVPSKSSAGIQRSPSDAGRSSGDEGKKPPSGMVRPPTTGSFGYKKIPGPSGALITSSGATLTGGSATLGKVPKSSAALAKGMSGVRKTSLDGSQPQDDGVLLSCSGSKVTLQYRSLPRPAKSSSGAAAGRSGHRSSSSSIDSNVSGKSAGAAGTQACAKRRDGKVGSERSSPITINQTDKEKVGVSDQDPAAGLSTSPKSSPTSSSAGQSGLRQPGSKYPDIASPTFRRSVTEPKLSLTRSSFVFVSHFVFLCESAIPPLFPHTCHWLFQHHNMPFLRRTFSAGQF